MGLDHLIDELDKHARREAQGNSTLLGFIETAEELGMPVKFLRTVMREYTMVFNAGSGTAHVKPFWNDLVLYEEDLSGLVRPESNRADFGTVSTLYHEATHAYVDIVDLDDKPLWQEAARHYQRARLESGKRVSDPDRVVHEAAAMYVGHRASTMYRAWRQMALVGGVLGSVEAKKATPARGEEIIRMMVPQGSIEAAYNLGMRRVVFGYDAKNAGRQDHVVAQPIPQQLRAYCDGVILEDKIKDDFRSMPVFRFAYARLQERMAVCRK
jgi:hypothetical protein